MPGDPKQQLPSWNKSNILGSVGFMCFKAGHISIPTDSGSFCNMWRASPLAPDQTCCHGWTCHPWWISQATNVFFFSAKQTEQITINVSTVRGICFSHYSNLSILEESHSQDDPKVLEILEPILETLTKMDMAMNQDPRNPRAKSKSQGYK